MSQGAMASVVLQATDIERHQEWTRTEFDIILGHLENSSVNMEDTYILFKYTIKKGGPIVTYL